MQLYEFDCSDRQRKLKGEYNDIFIFSLKFILTVLESGLVSTASTQLGSLEFAVEGESCRELFESFFDPLVHASPYRHVKMCMDIEMFYLINRTKLSYLESSRLFVFYDLLKKSFFTDKTTMTKNLEEIKDLSMFFCDYIGIDEIDKLSIRIQEALDRW